MAARDVLEEVGFGSVEAQIVGVGAGEDAEETAVDAVVAVGLLRHVGFEQEHEAEADGIDAEDAVVEAGWGVAVGGVGRQAVFAFAAVVGVDI